MAKDNLKNATKQMRKIKKDEAVRPPYAHGFAGYHGSPIFIPKRKK